MALLIAIVTFLAVAGIVLFIALLASKESKQEVISRRLEGVRKAERRGNTSAGLKLLRDEMLSSVPLINRWLSQRAWAMRFRNFLRQAGMNIKPAKFLLVCGVFGCAAYALAANMIPKFPGAAIPAGVAASMLPFVFVTVKRRRRLHKFEEHFPEALDLLGRAVRAGHAFTTGLEMIGKECPEPIAGEFRQTFDEQNFGLPLRDTLLNLTERVPLVDVRFFVTALMVQRETGGNLAEILDGLSRVIRDRFRIQREVRVKTAQGRLTAGILIALPPAMMFMLSVINPGYIRVLLEDPRGPMILGAAALSQLIGSTLIWKIIHIEI